MKTYSRWSRWWLPTPKQMELIDRMQMRPRRVVELADEMGLTHGRVSQLRASMESLGLIRETEKGWIATHKGERVLALAEMIEEEVTGERWFEAS